MPVFMPQGRSLAPVVIIPLPTHIMKAIAKDGPVGLVHIDAHTDTWDEFQGSKFMHGTPFRRAHEDGLLDASRRRSRLEFAALRTPRKAGRYSIEQGMRVGSWRNCY